MKWSQIKKLSAILLLVLSFVLSACTPVNQTVSTSASRDVAEEITENGYYFTAQEVSQYLRLYGHLPENYLTKNEAKSRGWVASKGNLQEIDDRAVIGGDQFANREGLLPEEPGRIYYECDVNYDGGHRGAERLVFSNDGLIFYTNDHYKSFVDVTKEGPS